MADFENAGSLAADCRDTGGSIVGVWRWSADRGDRSMSRFPGNENTRLSAPATPEHLIRLIAERRDPHAFKALFDHFAPRLKGFLLRQGLAEDQCEDVIQDVMITVWRKAESYDPGQASVGTWVYTITRNRRIDVLRRENKPDLDPEEPALQPIAPEGQEARVVREQETSSLREALKCLKPDQADLVRQAYFGGLTHTALAEKTGLPLGTVKSRIRLALLALRRQLGDDIR